MRHPGEQARALQLTLSAYAASTGHPEIYPETITITVAFVGMMSERCDSGASDAPRRTLRSKSRRANCQ